MSPPPTWEIGRYLVTGFKCYHQGQSLLLANQQHVFFTGPFGVHCILVHRSKGPNPFSCLYAVSSQAKQFDLSIFHFASYCAMDWSALDSFIKETVQCAMRRFTNNSSNKCQIHVGGFELLTSISWALNSLVCSTRVCNLLFLFLTCRFFIFFQYSAMINCLTLGNIQLIILHILSILKLSVLDWFGDNSKLDFQIFSWAAIDIMTFILFLQLHVEGIRFSFLLCSKLELQYSYLTFFS